MHFKMRIDKQVRIYHPGVKPRGCGVDLTDNEISIQLGCEFEMSADIRALSGVSTVGEELNHANLPLGVSMAPEVLGKDTIGAIGSCDGLVAVTFDHPVDAHITAPGSDGDSDTIQVRRVIVSMEEPDEFMQAANVLAPGRQPHMAEAI